MAVFGNPDGPYHESQSCAPDGAPQFLTEFAVEAGLDPCGLCQPPVPESSDRDFACSADISDEELVAALDEADTVADLVEAVPELERPSAVLWLVGRRGLSHRIATTHIDNADDIGGGV